MFGEPDREIFLQRFPEVARRPLLDHDERVVPRFLLTVGRPYFAEKLKSQKVRARELRIVGIFFCPRGERFVGKRDVSDEPRVRRVRTGTDRVVVERVVDAEIAHLHAAEVLITRRRRFHHLENVLLPFGKFRRRGFPLVGRRIGFLRSRRNVRWGGGG